MHSGALVGPGEYFWYHGSAILELSISFPRADIGHRKEIIGITYNRVCLASRSARDSCFTELRNYIQSITDEKSLFSLPSQKMIPVMVPFVDPTEYHR